MVIESINIRKADNGFIVSASGFTGEGDDRVWDNEEFVFIERKAAEKKLSELMKTM